MCGIYGSTIIYAEEVVREKLNRIAFRGPDYSSHRLYDERVYLGHNRLAIIDLDPRSNQPFEYEHLALTFNGEIYNYKAIKKILVEKGYNFRTGSDTEVICAAYLEYGDDCVSHFDGMFAFVIYDSKANKLFGAVDRLGQKPFYYTRQNNGLEFGSQISQLKISNQFTISERGTEEYLLRGYVTAPHTIYKECHKLPAGYQFVYDLSSHTMDIKSYWDLKPVQQVDHSYEEACNRVESLLTKATASRLMSDVSLGAFLSGGVDSSLVCAIAQQQLSDPLKTFSVKFSENEFDESKHAANIANHLGTDHTTIPCDPREALEMLSDFNRYYDEPFADSSAIPSMLISKHTKQHVTVALTGDAGDESFLGYKRYDWLTKLNNIYKLPSLGRKTLSVLLKGAKNYRYNIISQKLNDHDNIDDLVSSFLETMYPDLLTQKSNHKNNYQKYLQLSSHIIQKAADLDIKLWLAGDGLVKVDRASMAYSLECRSPFLDHRLMEYARSLPVAYRYDKGNKKKILKDILEKYVPKDLWDRPKQGFAIPVDKWMKDDLKEEVLDVLTVDNLKSIPVLNVDYFTKMMDAHYEGKLNFGPNIWNMFMYFKWRNSI